MTEASSYSLGSLIGGRLALDFANAGSAKHPLSWEELILFLEATQVISSQRSKLLLELPESDPVGAQALLERAAKLRSGMRQVFHGLVRHETPKAEHVEPVNVVLRVTEGHDELVLRDGSWKIEFVAREGGLEWLLAAIARSAAEIAGEGPKARVRLCANPDCGLFFYDDSRTRKRRWCSMAVCGNRHKVASFARKHGNRGRGRTSGQS
jgi:predicted RNA-binding Zn ribbon-like protein